MAETNTDSRTRCLTDLFGSESLGVQVPIVQRDYAQGRPQAAEVRERFLTSIYEAIDRASPDRPALDLDFVYGYLEDGIFVPIDGQQRLTTLFLLHWYLARRDGEQPHFLGWAAEALGETTHSRFRYAVRDSAEDFLHALTASQVSLDALLDADPGRSNALSKTIRNKHWYFRSWELDPTVRACLTMLDAIHSKFGQTEGFYRRLLGPSPAITFQFLDLEAFGLGDELYIKMNARGRPLTDFEVFKSEVEKFARSHTDLPERSKDGRSLPMHQHLGIQLDTTWSHLIWGLLRSEHGAQSDREEAVPTATTEWTRRLDPQLLNILRTLAIITHPEVDATGDEAKVVEKALEDLHNGLVTSFPGYEKRGAVTERWVTATVDLMDLWAGPPGADGNPTLRTLLDRSDYYDEAAMFRRVREDQPRRSDNRKPDGAVTYPELARFAAYCLYLESSLDQSGLDDWMRVTSNLARNSIITGGDSLRRALGGLQQLLKGMTSSGAGIIAHLAGGGAVEGFSRQQIREERIKAQLIQRSAEWRTLIERAELHPYFLGQIEFLLAFSGVGAAWLASETVSWTAEVDAELRDAFRLSLRRAEAVFAHPQGGLTPLPDFLWERALLCFGDYLLRPSPSSQKRSLGINAMDNPVSWKTLLRGELKVDGTLSAKRAVVGELFGHIDPDRLEASLSVVVAEGVQGNDDDCHWRGPLVGCPGLLAYCRRRNLLWQWSYVEGEGEGWRYQTYVLRGVRRGGFHDIQVWHHGGLLQKAHEAGKLPGVREVRIEEGSGSQTPSRVELWLPRHRSASIRIEHWRDRFHVIDLRGRQETKLFDCKTDKLVKRVRKWCRSLTDSDDG